MVLQAESLTDAGLDHFTVRNAPYFADTLLIATTSKTTTSAPITVQSHIPPPIHPYAWFITETLSFGSAVLYSDDFRQTQSILSRKASVHLGI
jgi:hypothetical protein